MIRISLWNINNDEIVTFFQSLSEETDILFHQNHADIYILEVKNKDDFNILATFYQTHETLIYVVGCESFELIQECMRRHVQLYFIKDRLALELQKYKQDILKDIQERFQCYDYQKRGMMIQLRLSHIYYVESMQHHLIIHCMSGTFTERKNLSEFLESAGQYFIQIHKSYIVNIYWIKERKNQEMILKNNVILPIGRAYRHQWKEGDR